MSEANKVLVGVIGLGRWGPNHIRNFNGIHNCRVVGAADPDAAKIKRMESAYPSVKFHRDYKDLLSSDVQAIVVATPTSTHFQIVKDALMAGKHVLCEKPLTTSGRDAWELVRLAKQKNVVLMTGHVFLFNAGITFLYQALTTRLVGKPYLLNAVRTNLGPFRSDVNAAWDLASHDIYVFNYLLNSRPISVSAAGGCFLRGSVEDVCFLTLRYPDNVLGHIHVSWLDPKKVREITIVGQNKMITWDEFGTPGPVTIYDRSVEREPIYETYGEFQLLAREGDVSLPRIVMTEPLAAQAKEFILRCSGGSDRPGCGSAEQGAEVVNVLEAASLSLSKNGEAITVTYES